MSKIPFLSNYLYEYIEEDYVKKIVQNNECNIISYGQLLKCENINNCVNSHDYVVIIGKTDIKKMLHDNVFYEKYKHKMYFVGNLCNCYFRDYNRYRNVFGSIKSKINIDLDRIKNILEYKNLPNLVEHITLMYDKKKSKENDEFFFENISSCNNEYYNKLLSYLPSSIAFFDKTVNWSLDDGKVSMTIHQKHVQDVEI